MDSNILTSNTILEHQLFIHSYLVDSQKKLFLPELCNLLQEIAWNHATSWHIGYSDLEENNLFWVLSRLLIKVKRWPEWQEKCLLKTWSMGIEGAFARREFCLSDSHDNEIIKATSNWVIINATTRRLQRIETIYNKYPFYKQPAINIHLEKIPSFKPDFISEPEPVKYSDIDMNLHVNNTRYIRRIIDSFDIDFLGRHEVDLFEINFLKEARHEERLKVERTQTEPLHFMASVNDDKNEFVRTRIHWRAV